jgi:hypothetical protein
MLRRSVVMLGAGAMPLTWLGGCATLQAPQTASLLAQPSSGVTAAHVEWTQVPFFPQTPYHCGPAALATVLAVLPIGHVTPESLAEGLYLPSRQGSLQVEMLAAARRAGAVPTRIPRTLQAVLQEVSAGHPVVVLMNLGLAIAPLWHYAVVVGYDLRASADAHVVMRSGTEPRDRMALSTFEHVWTRSDHWALVVRQPGDWPLTAEPEAMEAAAIAFERVGAAQAVLRTYDSLIKRHPTRWLGWFGRGHARMRADEGAQARLAVDDFRAALLHLEPLSSRAAEPAASSAQKDLVASIWNNLAQAWMRAGDTSQALAAVDVALALTEGRTSSVGDAVRQTHASLNRPSVR